MNNFIGQVEFAKTVGLSNVKNHIRQGFGKDAHPVRRHLRKVIKNSLASKKPKTVIRPVWN